MLPTPHADWLAIRISSARAASAITILMGGAVLFGWALGLPALESLIPGLTTMKINTALSFVLGGLSLWGRLGGLRHRAQPRVRGAVGAAAIVALIGLLTLAEYLFGWNIGIDLAPLPGSPTVNNAIGTSRMPPATALALLLIGVALLLLDTPRGRTVSRRLTYCALAIALLALVGYLYHVQALYAIVPYSSMAVHTALACAVLCVGMLCARPEHGVVAALSGQGAGSVLMRRLLPAAIGLPLLLGWLELVGARAGFYDTAFGLALFALSNIILFTALVWRNALYLNRADHERRQVEYRLQRFSEALEQRVIERTMEFTSANQKLEQANLAKDRFLANMSHELRTPLNAIIGFTGTLLMRLPGPLTAAQEKQLATIQSSAKHLLELINDVLDLSRIESGKRDLLVEPVACQEVIAEVIAALRPLAAAKGIGLQLDAPQQVISVLTDRRALNQILLNLVNNAIKFTDSGGVRIELMRPPAPPDRRPLTTDHRQLTTDARASNAAVGGRSPALNRVEGSVVIRVHDTGIGIRPEDQAKLFQVFSQLDASASRSYEGTGLGLYLCRTLAGMLDGQITLQSEYGQGSTFTLLLAAQSEPLADPERYANPGAELERRLNGQHSDRR